MNKIKITSILIAFAGMMTYCSQDKMLQEITPLKTELSLNDDYQYSGTTNEIGKLGRVLFYEKGLSVNNAISCGSCHKQHLAFADDVPFSLGFENSKTLRNTISLHDFQSGFLTFNFLPSQSSSLFWDGRSNSVSDAVIQPILNHVEMGIKTEKEIVNLLNTKGYYASLFKSAYGSEEITIDKVADALQGFLISLNSFDSKFDKSQSGAETLTPLEQEGERLFTEKYDCNSCHNILNPQGYGDFNDPTATADGFRNIGLNNNDVDLGRAEVTENEADKGKFRIPKLKNVALTAPYMHDGRFETLEDVLEHYSTGIQNNANLDESLAENGYPKKMNISETEKEAMVAFLNTLTDYSLISDPKFSDPFIVK